MNGLISLVLPLIASAPAEAKKDDKKKQEDLLKAAQTYLKASDAFQKALNDPDYTKLDIEKKKFELNEARIKILKGLANLKALIKLGDGNKVLEKSVNDLIDAVAETVKLADDTVKKNNKLIEGKDVAVVELKPEDAPKDKKLGSFDNPIKPSKDHYIVLLPQTNKELVAGLRKAIKDNGFSTEFGLKVVKERFGEDAVSLVKEFAAEKDDDKLIKKLDADKDLKKKALTFLRDFTTNGKDPYDQNRVADDGDFPKFTLIAPVGDSNKVGSPETFRLQKGVEFVKDSAKYVWVINPHNGQKQLWTEFELEVSKDPKKPREKDNLQRVKVMVAEGARFSTAIINDYGDKPQKAFIIPKYFEMHEKLKLDEPLKDVNKDLKKLADG